MTRRKIKAPAARYIKYVEWSEEDHCFMGRCPEVFIGAVHGTDEARVYAELCATVAEWLELLHGDGIEPPEPLTAKKEFSGKFVLG